MTFFDIDNRSVRRVLEMILSLKEKGGTTTGWAALTVGEQSVRNYGVH
jgi:hypothetical protein